jgi:hypothetical protein
MIRTSRRDLMFLFRYVYFQVTSASFLSDTTYLAKSICLREAVVRLVHEIRQCQGKV